jgi:hypothetical protein
MMKVLVVHDRANVASEITALLKTSVPDATIEVASDIVSARTRLSAVIYDLLIIDLTLPHSRGALPDVRSADELLKVYAWDFEYPWRCHRHHERRRSACVGEPFSWTPPYGCHTRDKRR